MGSIFAIANQKGGVGKTTTAVNLSTCLAVKGRRVLLVDMDPQGNATSGLGLNKRAAHATVYDVLCNGQAMAQVVQPTVQAGLFLAPAGVDLAGAEVELVGVQGREHILKAALQSVRDQYDEILIDCPPSLGLLTLNSLTAADRIVVPIQCEFYALEGLTQLMSTVSAVRKRLNPALAVEGVVLTMYDGRTNLSAQVAQEVQRHFADKVYQTLIPRNVRLSEAPSYGLPVTQYDAASSGAEAYMRLAAEFLHRREGA